MRKSIVLLSILALLGAGTFWATASLAAKPDRAVLPSAGLKVVCPDSGSGVSSSGSWGKDHDGTTWDHSLHTGMFEGVGTFVEKHAEPADPIVVEFGEPYLAANDQKIVPFKILSIGGRAFADGIGETRFWLDSSRPVTSAIWEKKPGTDFPAIQEMRFHFFYTLEAMPGRIFRSIQPAIMRSNDVRSVPPPPGTKYTLARSVELEDVAEPGIVVGKILSNQLTIPGAPRQPHLKPGK